MMTSEYGCSSFEETDASADAFLFGRIPHATDEVKDDACNAAHGETVSEVIDYAVRTRLLSHRHCLLT